MSRQDFIAIANILVNQINSGYVKKKDIEQFIQTACNGLGGTFNENIFKAYIKDRV